MGCLGQLIKWLANLGMTCAAPIRRLHATHIDNQPALLRPPSSLLHDIHYPFLRSFTTTYPSPSCCSPSCSFYFKRTELRPASNPSWLHERKPLRPVQAGSIPTLC